MYSRRLHTALGRSRCSGNDVSRITDGVIASMRQLHITASRQEEERDDITPAQRPSERTQRSQIAAEEITSLPVSRPSRGIDARSLAAKPPPGVRPSLIRRTVVSTRLDRGELRQSLRESADGTSPGGSFAATGIRREINDSNPNYGRGRGDGSFTARAPGNRGGFFAREGFSVRGGRGRGGARGGRGRGGRGGRGRGRRGGRPGEVEEAPRVYSPEEWTFHCAQTYGVVTPSIVGQITKRSLLELAPSSPITKNGRKNTVKERMNILADRRMPNSANLMRQRLMENKFVSFRNEEERKAVLGGIGEKKKTASEEFYNIVRSRMEKEGDEFTFKEGKELTFADLANLKRTANYKNLASLGKEEEVLARFYAKKKITPVDFAGGKNAITTQLIGGEYDSAIRAVPAKDPLAVVKRYTLQNSSYLSGDGKTVLQKVESLLPRSPLARRREQKAELA